MFLVLFTLLCQGDLPLQRNRGASIWTLLKYILVLRISAILCIIQLMWIICDPVICALTELQLTIQLQLTVL